MQSNPAFDIAVDFVNNTACNIFLTGKAGTGKTTFLKYIKEHSPKKAVVVAPTGVAAINAGGVTMHSFFQLPFGPYVPVVRKFETDTATDKRTLFKDIRFGTEKRELLQDLDLLIIDEVSMVRCDTLDAMDAILRYFRNKPDRPFGGVQVLFIGDLFQLPPVMPDGEWSLLREYYESPFFFHSKVIGQAPPVYIELKKIYRQNEQRFINILNNIRNNEASEDDLEILNAKFGAGPVEGKNYITLTSHNYKADKINQEELRKLSGDLHEFKGAIEGDFPEKVLPTEMFLQLKEGAQVMFIRNDKSEERKYFNGKIVTVSKIDERGIHVVFPESQVDLLLEKETWDNIRYSYNQNEGKIDEEKLGSFSQYPIRLAWAITIHKSQGLTFEHAIIDAGDSFAPGQVYVALSRCTSLNGLVLHSRILPRSISTNEQVLAFAGKEISPHALGNILGQEKVVFLNKVLIEVFDFHVLAGTLENHVTFVSGRKLPDLQGAVTTASCMSGNVRDMQKVSLKFQDQLRELLRQNDNDKLKERVTKAIEYFTKSLSDNLLQPLDKHIESLKGQKKIRKYLKRIREVRSAIVRKIKDIQHARYGEVVFDTSAIEVALPEEPAVVRSGKAEKGASLKETLTLFRSGLQLAEIAAKRSLALSTIEGHFALLVKSGDIEIHEVLEEKKLGTILDVINEMKGLSLTAIKQKLGDNASFGEIRMVLNHLEFVQAGIPNVN